MTPETALRPPNPYTPDTQVQSYTTYTQNNIEAFTNSSITKSLWRPKRTEVKQILTAPAPAPQEATECSNKTG